MSNDKPRFVRAIPIYFLLSLCYDKANHKYQSMKGGAPLDEQLEQLETEGISLAELWAMIRKHLVFIILAVFVCVGLAYGYTRFLEKPTYTAKTTLVVRIPTNTETGDITTSDISIAKSLALVYSDFLKTDQVMTHVIETLGIDYSIATLRDNVLTMTLGESSLLLYISAKTTDPNRSIAIVNQVATSGIAFINAEFESYGEKLAVLNVATSSIISRNTAMNLAIGLLLGGLISAAYVLIREMMAKTIRSRKDIEKLTGLPIIGLIPDYGFEETEATLGSFREVVRKKVHKQ